MNSLSQIESQAPLSDEGTSGTGNETGESNIMLACVGVTLMIVMGVVYLALPRFLPH